MKSILVTGGAGYIGSHTVRLLAKRGYHPLSYDNLSEGHREAVSDGDLIVGELRDEDSLSSVFSRYNIEAVMHFASRCYVGESMENPRLYYEQNLGTAMTLLRVMLEHDVSKFVLSSSCAVYGYPEQIPIVETHPERPVNPYGETKLFIEKILKQYDRAYDLRFVSLRYFNAAGASLDGRLGEAHCPETHLIPRVLRVAKAEEEEIQIFGDDYPTRDGSCVRDYVHVLDLSSAHIAAYEWLARGNPSEIFNLGTGKGYTVKEIIRVAEQVTGHEIPVAVCSRRSGDPPQLVAQAEKAKRLLGWKAELSEIGNIIATAWKWEQNRIY